MEQQAQISLPRRGGIPGTVVLIVALGAIALLAIGVAVGTLWSGKTSPAPTGPITSQQNGSTGADASASNTASAAASKQKSTTILERPAAPPLMPAETFRGRTTPSATFPLRDEEYIELGRKAIAGMDTRTRESLFAFLGNPATIDASTPLRVWEDQLRQRLYIYYGMTAHNKENSAAPQFRYLYVKLPPAGSLSKPEISISNKLPEEWP